MRYEQKTVRVGEWLGDVPDDWDYEDFNQKYLVSGCGNLEYHNQRYQKSIKLFKEMSEALKNGKTVFASDGNFTHEVVKCGLYDGWVFWVPRPCYAYIGPLPVEHRAELYGIISITIE